MWKFSWRTSYDINAADTIISDNTVFISSGYNKGCALYRINGRDVAKVWQNKNMRNHVNSSVLWEGHVYGFDGQVGGGGKLTCVDFGTGEKKWSQEGMGTGSLMLAGGKLIILGERGKLVIAEASPQGFKELSSAQILPKTKCWTVPVLANGRIYARSAAGHLVCVDVSGKS
jgi:outer membrane protein assembly factor BamB